MTPFGARLRALRARDGMTLKDMAAKLQVSTAYLSALEHGKRGAPSAGLVHQVNEFFGLIWDAAEDLAGLARLSHPRVTVNTAGLTPEQRLDIKRAFKLLYRTGLNYRDAVTRIRAELPPGPAQELADFVATSKRGIAGVTGATDDAGG